MFEDLTGKGLLIHHWDTDGVCSAALLLEKLEGRRLENWTPPIGQFYLTPGQIEWASGFDYVLIVDMALPVGDVRGVAESARVIIFDHHHQPVIEGVEHINPVAHHAPTEDYPSASWVVNRHLGDPVNLYTLLGIVGDREHMIKDNPKFWPLIQGYCRQNDLTFEDLHRLAELIDSCSKVGDREGVMEAPHLLMSYKEPEDILGNEEWKRNLVMLEEEIRDILETPPEEVEGVLLKRLDTSYSVISTITRRIAWGSGRNTVVVNTGFFPEEDQLYARSSTADMQPLIERARELGFNAGGKKDVLGAIIPKSRTEAFIKEAVEYLRRVRE